MTTATVEDRLDVSRRRARETLLEATRIGLLRQEPGRERTTDDENSEEFETTDAGVEFLSAIQSELWGQAADVLHGGSPHYRAFCSTVATAGPGTLDEILAVLEEEKAASPYTFNETTVEVVGDWAERLGSVARNAFTGSYYTVDEERSTGSFSSTLLDVFDDLEDSAGVDLVQRYLSIPDLREHTCERLNCRRATFDDQLAELVQANVGKLELSGAPVDTGAKDARYGIKQIAAIDRRSAESTDTDDSAGSRNLVSTTQSTDAVMDGIEQFGKQYYYLAVHDREFAATDTTAEDGENS